MATPKKQDRYIESLMKGRRKIQKALGVTPEQQSRVAKKKAEGKNPYSWKSWFKK